RVVHDRLSRSVHDQGLPHPSGEAAPRSRRHPRGRHRTAPDRFTAGKPPLLETDRRLRPPHRRAHGAQHLLQRERADRQHTDRGARLLPAHPHGPVGARQRRAVPHLVRILLVSHAPLTAELGAAQSALHLAAALRDRGHDAAAWSPVPLPPGTRWWSFLRRQREAIEAFAAAHGPFDVIDTPAVSASHHLARWGCLVVRSIQPELLYLWQEVLGSLGQRLPPLPRALVHAALAIPRGIAIVSGWRRARFIFCLGDIELSWMLQRFPRWRPKLGSYACAPASSERLALAEI